MPSPPASERPEGGRSGGRGGRRRFLVVVALLAAIVALDALRPPEEQWAARAALGAIHLYQATLSSRLPAVGISCRYEPTCSRYTEAAIREDGAVVGTLRGLGRILRCGPWVEAGTPDPP